MFVSRPRRRFTSRSISASLTQSPCVGEERDHLLGVLARRERGVDEVVLDLAVFAAATSAMPNAWSIARPARPTCW